MYGWLATFKYKIFNFNQKIIHFNLGDLIVVEVDKNEARRAWPDEPDESISMGWTKGKLISCK